MEWRHWKKQFNLMKIIHLHTFTGESFHLSGELEIALAKLRLAYQLDLKSRDQRVFNRR